MKVKLDPGAYLPQRAHETDAGLEELSQRVPQWIPVTERLPDDDVGDWCIAYVEGVEGYVYYCGAVICVDYDHSTGNFFDGSLCITNLVRYWMPMPEPPEDEQ